MQRKIFLIRLGLLGKNISHSKSQMMYEELLGEKIDYTLYDCNLPSDVPTLGSFFDNIQGLSITTPYKEHFLKKVTIDNKIENLNAVNCIKKNGDKFYATNTDYSAINELLLSSEFNLSQSEVVILGAP